MLPTITYFVQCMVWGHKHTKLVLPHEIVRRLVNGQNKTTAVIHTFEIVENECIFAKIQFLVSQPVEDLQAVIAQLLGCINSSSFRHRVATARAIMVYVTTPTNIPEELIWYASVPRLPLRIFRVGSGTARLVPIISHPW